MDALRSQPFDGEFDGIVPVLPKVFLGCIQALSKSKVSNFDDKVYIYPGVIIYLYNSSDYGQLTHIAD